MIPKSVTLCRIQENFEATKVSFTEEEVQPLVGIGKNHRLLNSVGAFLPKGETTETAFDVEADDKFVIQK